ncbi:ribosome small subunit-dependent GTPase A [Chloroherpeton thalassium ATCC 35110]|uniref:Small ribosomal subunit biogenesis GTPase RsgA n=1 Tax=Chloroherpeton thalassium (strain ATCC 35110 / GB-78) TaxID=517418 RepID=B3QWC8_CHLT3|nr:ribosome small subunit-dependent GTPase A [Chloroherpeton thalassium]ACF13241.1 ribosome small subunit-dependent GTPase A [Chloroherpeton thalassium ATCC 35110]
MSKFQEKYPKNIKAISDENFLDLQNSSPKTSLEQLGYDEWFQRQSENLLTDDFSVARIIEVNKNNYKISDGQHEIFAELSGKFLFAIETILDYPTVGDWVVVQCFDNNSHAIIHHILPRKSLLKRKDPGKAIDFQLIAANIDYALIMQAVDSNFNLNRLERYLVMIHESHIQPIIILSKTDLISENELAIMMENILHFNKKYLLLSISNITEDGIRSLQKELQSDKTYCLLGSSGVGKTTLFNKLLGEARFGVNEVREKDSKGRHTTTRRQLLRLESGSIFIDTPGMREIGTFAIDSGLDETFDEIVSLSRECRFQDCSHTHEDGCAVKDAVLNGTIDEARYQNFLKIQKESNYYEMSYLEKRKKDKSFGKMMKNYKKSIRKK